MLDLSQYILYGFNKPTLGSQMILATVDFSKPFDSARHPVLFHKFILLAFLLALFIGLNLFFLMACLRSLSKSQKLLLSTSLRCSARICSRLCTFLFINNLPAFSLSSSSCSLYANDLAIWSSSLSIPAVVEVTQGTLI